MRSFVLQDRTGPLDPIAHDVGLLRSRHVDLTQQHHDLDYMISNLSALTGCDELLVARLKKRKLQLKDEIARIASNIHRLGDSTAHP